jgi:hypothetical protein
MSTLTSRHSISTFHCLHHVPYRQRHIAKGSVVINNVGFVISTCIRSLGTADQRHRFDIQDEAALAISKDAKHLL